MKWYQHMENKWWYCWTWWTENLKLACKCVVEWMGKGGAWNQNCVHCCMCVFASRVLISLLTKQRGVHQQQIPLQLFRGLAWKMNGFFLEWEVQCFCGSSQSFSLLHTHTEVRLSNWFLTAMTVDHCVCLVIGLNHNYWGAVPIASTLRYCEILQLFWHKILPSVYCGVYCTTEGKQLDINSPLTCTTSILDIAQNFLQCNRKTLQKFHRKTRLSSMAFLYC